MEVLKMDNLLVYVWKIKAEDCKKYDGLIARYNNSKDLFECTKDNEKRLVSGALTFKELTQRVIDGKIAVFPIWEKQETENIEGHIKYGFSVILLKYRDYNNFLDYYKENAVEINKENVLKELKQKELF
jgi:hypothetical protein